MRLTTNPPLRSHRHDDGVLDLLRLHEPENLRAEILAPIRPADAAARDVTHAQVHALHPRREYEYLEQRLRQRQFAQLLAFDLEREIFLELSVGAVLIGVGAHRRGQGAPQGPQDSVLIGEGHLLELRTDFGVEPRERGRTRGLREPRIEAGRE